MKIRSVILFFPALLSFQLHGNKKQDQKSLKPAILEIIHENKEVDLQMDEGLDKAARAAAKKIIDASLAEDNNKDKVRAAVLDAIWETGITDKKIFPLAIISDSPAGLLESFSKFMKEEGPGEMGGKRVGLESFYDGARAVCVLICVDRVIELKNVPARLSSPAKYLLGGRILKDVSNLHVIVQTPDLRFLKPTINIKGSNFSLILPLNGPAGLYRTEILGDLGYGPSVLNLFNTLVGPEQEAGGNPLPVDLLDASLNEAGERPVKAKNRAWALFHLVNALREKRGLEPLRVSDPLSRSALLHCRDMKKNGFFGHTSPLEGSLERRIEKSGISFSSVAEVMTIAGSPQEAVRNLVSSPSHLSQLLGEAYTHMGVAVVKAGEGSYYVAVIACF